MQGKEDDHPVVMPLNRDLNILRPENPSIGEMEDLEPRLVVKVNSTIQSRFFSECAGFWNILSIFGASGYKNKILNVQSIKTILIIDMIVQDPQSLVHLIYISKQQTAFSFISIDIAFFCLLVRRKHLSKICTGKNLELIAAPFYSRKCYERIFFIHT